MRLTQHTDYGLRILLYLGLKKDRATTQELSENFKMSKNHVAKIVYQMGLRGWLKNSKGKGGGVRLAIDPATLFLGKAVEELEPDFRIVECFDPKHNRCPIAGACKLENVLHSAKKEFIAVLNQFTLADLLKSSKRDPRRNLLNLPTEL